MTEQEFREMKSDLQEIKEMMKVISKQVAADKEIGAARVLRKMEDDRIARQIRSMASLAD